MLLFLIALLARILKVKIRMDYSTVVPFHKEFLKKYFYGNIPVRNISECANKIRFEEIDD